MKKKERGVRLCPSCSSTMHESVDDWGDSFHKCSNCGTKIRIFHERVKPNHKPIDLNNRFNNDIDSTGCS